MPLYDFALDYSLTNVGHLEDVLRHDYSSMALCIAFAMRSGPGM